MFDKILYNEFNKSELNVFVNNMTKIDNYNLAYLTKFKEKLLGPNFDDDMIVSNYIPFNTKYLDSDLLNFNIDIINEDLDTQIYKDNKLIKINKLKNNDNVRLLLEYKGIEIDSKTMKFSAIWKISRIKVNIKKKSNSTSGMGLLIESDDEDDIEKVTLEKVDKLMENLHIESNKFTNELNNKELNNEESNELNNQESYELNNQESYELNNESNGLNNQESNGLNNQESNGLNNQESNELNNQESKN